MNAINRNSYKSWIKVVGDAPRGKRALWLLNIQVGTQSISPLMWSIERDSRESARAIITNLAYFASWQEMVGLALVYFLLVMLALEPILHCTNSGGELVEEHTAEGQRMHHDFAKVPAGRMTL